MCLAIGCCNPQLVAQSRESRVQSRPTLVKPSSKRKAPASSLAVRRDHSSIDVRCGTAALEREVLPAEAPEEDFVNREVLPAPAPGELQHNATVFVEEHRIRAYEVGADQKTTISTMANLLQVSLHPCQAFSSLHSTGITNDTILRVCVLLHVTLHAARHCRKLLAIMA